MSAATLTIGEAARILRDATKDKTYRTTPLGQEVARYIRWKRNEWGATEETLRDYESILAKLALFFADLDLPDFSPPEGKERLRECLDAIWGERTGRTRSKVRSVWIDFFEWAVNERGLTGNPARALARPKQRDTKIHTFGESVVEQILGSQTYPADWCACLLILKYGLRKGGLCNIQRKHFDFEQATLTVTSKGGRVYTLPIVDAAFWMKLALLSLEAQWGPDDFLLYRTDTRQGRVAAGESEETLHLAPGQVNHYAKITRRFHDRKVGGHCAHDWWYRCLERARVVDLDVRSGMNMHRGRHTAITGLLRDSHNLKLAQLLAGHRDIKSTAAYAQLDTGDLADALRRMDD